MNRLISLVLAVIACSGSSPSERYAFVTTLGRDTVAVENASRSARRLVTDGVDRWPFVRRRHTVFDLDATGRLRRMDMEVRTPSGATPARRWRRITAEFSSDRVHISIRDSSGVRDTAFSTGGAITVPHVSMMYSVIEQEVDAALRQQAASAGSAIDTVPFRQFYPDRDVGPAFALHHGLVRILDGGRIELTHDWLSGIGDIRADTAGRLLSYSGTRSTYQVAVVRRDTVSDLEAIATRMGEAERRTGARQLSVRDTTRANIGVASFLVDYGRPLMRGRTLVGDVIPYDYIWRTGANAATQFTTTAPVTVAGLQLAAGTYTLWTVPRTDGVDFIVNRQAGQWGTNYDRSHDVGRAPMGVETRPDTVEQFTITIEPTDAKRGTLVLRWGTFRWTVPIIVE